MKSFNPCFEWWFMHWLRLNTQHNHVVFLRHFPILLGRSSTGSPCRPWWAILILWRVAEQELLACVQCETPLQRSAWCSNYIAFILLITNTIIFSDTDTDCCLSGERGDPRSRLSSQCAEGSVVCSPLEHALQQRSEGIWIVRYLQRQPAEGIPR